MKARSATLARGRLRSRLPRRFTWNSFDFSCNNGRCEIIVTGFLGGLEQFDAADALSATNGFVQSPNFYGFSSRPIDALDIQVSNDGSNATSAIYIDNVVVNPVPEPGSLLLLISSGLGLIGYRHVFGCVVLTRHLSPANSPPNLTVESTVYAFTPVATGRSICRTIASPCVLMPKCVLSSRCTGNWREA